MKRSWLPPDDTEFSEELRETFYLCGYDAKAAVERAKAVKLAQNKDESDSTRSQDH